MQLSLTARPDAFGVVTIRAKGGAVRSYRITADELAAFKKQGGAPVGCTADEWQTARVVIEGYSTDVGEMEQRPDGSVVFISAARQEGDQYVFAQVILAPEEYRGVAPRITANADILPTLKQGTSRGDLVPSAIVDGEMSF